MHLMLAAIAAALGMYLSPGNIGDVPFSALTLNMLIASVATIVCYLGAIYLMFQSLEKDRIWPWRWTLPYLGNFIYKIICSSFMAACAYFLAEKFHLGGFLLNAGVVVLGIVILTILFSSEFELFKEKTMVENPEND